MRRLCKLLRAVTEHEVHRGMLQCEDAAKTSFCIRRCITNLLENIHHRRARKFVDVVTSAADTQPSSVDIDVDAQCMLTNLRQEKIATVLGPGSIVDFDLSWRNVEEADANEDEVYLFEFMAVFEEKMLELIERAVSEQRSVSRDSHVVEIMQHLTVCKQRSQVCLITICVVLSQF